MAKYVQFFFRFDDGKHDEKKNKSSQSLLEDPEDDEPLDQESFIVQKEAQEDQDEVKDHKQDLEQDQDPEKDQDLEEDQDPDPEPDTRLLSSIGSSSEDPALLSDCSPLSNDSSLLSDFSQSSLPKIDFPSNFLDIKEDDFHSLPPSEDVGASSTCEPQVEDLISFSTLPEDEEKYEIKKTDILSKGLKVGGFLGECWGEYVGNSSDMTTNKTGLQYKDPNTYTSLWYDAPSGVRMTGVPAAHDSTAPPLVPPRPAWRMTPVTSHSPTPTPSPPQIPLPSQRPPPTQRPLYPTHSPPQPELSSLSQPEILSFSTTPSPPQPVHPPPSLPSPASPLLITPTQPLPLPGEHLAVKLGSPTGSRHDTKEQMVEANTVSVAARAVCHDDPAKDLGSQKIEDDNHAQSSLVKSEVHCMKSGKVVYKASIYIDHLEDSEEKNPSGTPQVQEQEPAPNGSVVKDKESLCVLEDLEKSEKNPSEGGKDDTNEGILQGKNESKNVPKDNKRSEDPRGCPSGKLSPIAEVGSFEIEEYSDEEPICLESEDPSISSPIPNNGLMFRRGDGIIRRKSADRQDSLQRDSTSTAKEGNNLAQTLREGITPDPNYVPSSTYDLFLAGSNPRSPKEVTDSPQSPKSPRVPSPRAEASENLSLIKESDQEIDEISSLLLLPVPFNKVKEKDKSGEERSLFSKIRKRASVKMKYPSSKNAFVPHSSPKSPERKIESNESSPLLSLSLATYEASIGCALKDKGPGPLNIGKLSLDGKMSGKEGPVIGNPEDISFRETAVDVLHRGLSGDERRPPFPGDQKALGAVPKKTESKGIKAKVKEVSRIPVAQKNVQNLKSTINYSKSCSRPSSAGSTKGKGTKEESRAFKEDGGKHLKEDKKEKPLASHHKIERSNSCPYWAKSDSGTSSQLTTIKKASTFLCADEDAKNLRGSENFKGSENLPKNRKKGSSHQRTKSYDMASMFYVDDCQTILRGKSTSLEDLTGPPAPFQEVAGSKLIRPSSMNFLCMDNQTVIPTPPEVTTDSRGHFLPETDDKTVFTSPYQLTQQSRDKSYVQRLMERFQGPPDAKMDLLVQQLDHYSKHGIPKQPHLLACHGSELDAEEVVFEEGLRDHLSSGKLTDRQEQQQSAIWELVETEVTYIHMLKVITDLFLACLCNLQNESLLYEIDTDKLFSNIQEIYAANLKFWKEHILVMLENSCQAKEPLDPTILYDAFFRFDEIFHPYTRYCLEQSNCQLYCKEKYHENECFKMYLAWCETQKECNRLRLVDILVHPMQRLTKYSLLLKAILKKTDLEDHKIRLVEMIEHVECFVSNVNSALRHRHEQDRLREIINRIESYDAVESRDDELERAVRNHSDLNLTQPMPGCPEHLSRHLLHHGDLKLRDAHTSKMDVHVFLFTDLLLITKVTQRKAEKVKVVRPPYLVARLVLVELKDSSSLGFVYLNEWHVAVAAFTLQCHDVRALRTWHETLKRAQGQYREAQQAQDILYDPEEEFPVGAQLAPRSPRPGSSRASRVSSLMHSHSGSVDLNEPSFASSTQHPPSVDLSDVRASSASSDDSVPGRNSEIQRSRSLEGQACHQQATSPRPERRPLLSKTPNTLSVTPPYTTGQSLPNLTVDSPHSLRVPGSNHKQLSPSQRGVSYPPPSPRTLRRSAPVPQSRNPPLMKTRHVTSTIGSPQANENQTLDPNADPDDQSRGQRRISRTERLDNRRYHTAGAIDDIKKQDTKDAAIHKRLSWNYGQGPPPGSRELSTENSSSRLSRHRTANKSISCESMHSSSGVSSTSSLHRSMGSELEALEHIDDNELRADSEGTIVDLTVSECTSLKISPHISTTYISHDSEITLGGCSQYITQPMDSHEAGETCTTPGAVKIDVSKVENGSSSVQITVTEGTASPSTTASTNPFLEDSTQMSATPKESLFRMREILLNDASVEASDV